MKKLFSVFVEINFSDLLTVKIHIKYAAFAYVWGLPFLLITYKKPNVVYTAILAHMIHSANFIVSLKQYL